MEVRDCPQCGSDCVNKSSSSFEYGGSTRWSCEDCEWYYKQGRGIGTGTGNSGTHPRKLSGGNQTTLTQTGEYCKNCEVVLKGDHACTAKEIVEESDSPLKQEEVIERLEEYHYSGHSVLKDAVEDRHVALTPTFFQVVEWPRSETRYVNDRPEPEMVDVIRSEIKQMRDEGETEYVNGNELRNRLAAQNKIEYAFISVCISFMKRNGEIQRSMKGLKLRDS